MFPLLRVNSEQVEILRLFVVESRILGIGIREPVGGRLGQECCVECMPKAKGRAKVDRNVVIIGAAT